jgi:Arc/MetJ-type ribon-helix-helix transcriptional regulator
MVRPKPRRLEGLTLLTVVLADDLQRLLRSKVENGDFPNEEAVVEEAVKCFLAQEPSRGRRQGDSPTEILEVRLPGPFLEVQTTLAPIELPRPGREVACSSLPDGTRRPTLFPGE